MKFRDKVRFTLDVAIVLLTAAAACVVVKGYVVTRGVQPGGSAGGMQAQKGVRGAAAVEARKAPTGPDSVSPEELRRMLAAGEDVVVVDIRDREEFAKGHIPSAVNLPYDEIYSRALDELPQNKLIVVSSVECSGDQVSRIIRSDLNYLGFTRSTVLTQGIVGWRRAGFKMEMTAYAGLATTRP